MSRYFPKPRRNDHAQAMRWRGALFWEFDPPLMWKDFDHYEMLERPGSVTFPICEGCGHVIWDWPHFEEEVPKHCICDRCAEEDEEGQWLDDDR